MLAAANPETDSNDPKGVNWVRKLDYAAISNQLRTHTGNFLNHIRANHDTMDANEVFPGKHLVEQSIQSLADAVPLIIYNSPWVATETWTKTAIPTTRMSTLGITAGTYNPASGSFSATLYNQTRFMPELQGKRLDRSFDGGVAGIHLGGSTLGNTFTPAEAAFDLRLAASHDHYTWAYNSSTGYYKTDTARSYQESVQRYRKDNAFTYTLPNAFDDSTKLIRARQKVLADYYRDGLTYAADREVTAETLNVMGLEWYAQAWRIHRMVASLAGGVTGFVHGYGRVAQEVNFYIDVTCYRTASTHLGLWEVYSRNISRLSALFMSAMEHGDVEQLLGKDAGAASTVRVIHEANAAHQKIYRATAANWSSISSGLSGYDNIACIVADMWQPLAV